VIIDHNFLLRVQVRVAAAAELVLVFKLATEIAPDFVLFLGAQMVVFL
jgi:hypothetical protein